MMPRARRRGRSDRGATLVEAAIVTPMVFLCLFGIMEFGLVMSSVSTTSSASRDGARFAAAQFAVTANRLDAANLIRDEVQGDLSALTGFGTPEVLWIYRADAATGDPILGAGFSSCNTSCYRYTWSAGTGTFVYDTGSPGWSNPDACLSSGGVLNSIDSVGVYVRTSHHSATGLAGDRTINEHVSMRLEPLPSTQCA